MAAVNKDTQSQAPPSSSPEDDLLKRSTDCVYFLASTCIKGSECEYRHSELARTNPTDCYYWLSGKCSLNVSCAFRHPPLDVAAMPQVGIYAGPSHPVHPSAKQATPCYYFQIGNCSKGDLCKYLHGPIPTPYSKSKAVPSASTSTEAPTFKKTFGFPDKGPQMKTNTYSRASNITETPRLPQVNAAPKVVKAPVVTAPPLINGSLSTRAVRSYHASSIDDQNHQNGRDVDDQNERDFDDSLRESSPGFDVLVDDKLAEDEEYYHNEEQYVRMRDHDGRRSSEVDMGGRDDYNSVTGADRDIYRSKYGYDAYDDVRDSYIPQERHGAPSERLSVHGRRGPSNTKSPDFIQNSSDLRHRLSKQRSGNDLRSVINPDYKSSYHPEDRGFRSSQRDTRPSMLDTIYHPEDRGYRSSRRDSRSPLRETVYHSEDRGYLMSQRDTRSPTRGSSIGSRLQGRIKLPRRSSPLSGRVNDNERYLGRLSPSRPRQSSLQGRLRDRLGRRVQEESNEGPDFRGGIRGGSISQANGDLFVGPRRLSEVTQIPVSGGKLKGTAVANSVGNEADTSFDGPKPLSEILKRKRNASVTASSDIENCDNKEGKKQDENDVNLTSSPSNPGALISAPEQTQGDVQVNNDALTVKRYEEEGQISNKKIKLIEDESSFPNDEKHTEVEEGLFGDDGDQPEVDEEFDQGDGEYEYEQDDDAEGYDLNEGEVDVGDNEGIMDEDDGDDFAKKLGISF